MVERKPIALAQASVQVDVHDQPQHPVPVCDHNSGKRGVAPLNTAWISPAGVSGGAWWAGSAIWPMGME